MRRLRPALLALAIAFAALPSPAAAAAPNELLDPKVSPGSGNTTTAFAFSVRYVSQKGWPALSGSASVAGKTVALKRTAGTAVDGIWSASAGLPAGTWSVTFSADAEQGPDPSVAGPTVTVTVAATPKPPPAATPKPAAPAPQPAAPAPAPAEPTPIPAPSADSTTAAARTPGPATPTASPSATPNPTVLPSPHASRPSTATALPRAAPTAEAVATSSGGRKGEADAAVLGIVALAALLLGASGLALLWSRRRSPSPAAPESAASPTAAVHVDERPRAGLRHPRLDPIGSEDPILAAMGVGNERRKES